MSQDSSLTGEEEQVQSISTIDAMAAKSSCVFQKHFTD